MHFQHADDIWARFATLVPGALRVDGVRADRNVDSAVSVLVARAQARLATGSEAEWPAIQAWRRGFSAMGLKPTQYRCAAEALLRRLRKEGSLPGLHPLVDLCNAVSVAWAIPVAAFDLDRISGSLTVRTATGSETHLEFSGALEHPEPGEVVFADTAGSTHARRWCHRQSAASVIRPDTTRALIVAEALHDGADQDVRAATEALAAALTQAGLHCSPIKLLQRNDPVFAFGR